MWEPRQEGDRSLVFAKGGCFTVRVLDGTQARHRPRITWAIESARGHLPRLPHWLWPEAASDAAGIKFRHVLSFLSSVTCDVCVRACLFYGTACFLNSLQVGGGFIRKRGRLPPGVTAAGSVEQGPTLRKALRRVALRQTVTSSRKTVGAPRSEQRRDRTDRGTGELHNELAKAGGFVWVQCGKEHAASLLPASRWRLRAGRAPGSVPACRRVGAPVARGAGSRAAGAHGSGSLF